MAAFLIFLVAVVCILGKLSQPYTRLLLSGIRLSLELLATTCLDGKAVTKVKRIISDIPKDIRRVRETLKLVPPKSTTYACCPKYECFFLYAPDAEGMWPKLCSNTLSDGSICDTPLLMPIPSGSDLSVPIKRRPIKPYVLFDLKEMIAELLTLEPTASRMRNGTDLPELDANSTITDILQGGLAQNFQGPLKGPKGTWSWFDCRADEIRLLFSLSVDWMNPYGKGSAVSASVGVIALCCLNLPITERYKPENMILLGLIPGPRDPPIEALNHFIRPIVDDFIILWESGLQLVSKGSSDVGARFEYVRAAVLAVVTDLPASKKLTGNMSYSSNSPCTICGIRKVDLSNLDRSTWPIRTVEQHRKDAFEWLYASNSKRKVLEQSSKGVRFSEIDRLPYWNPILQAVVDIMHNLFLGIIKRHFTVVLGMTTSNKPPGGKHLYEQPDEDKMKRARALLNRGCEPNHLKNSCTWPVLYALSSECGTKLEEERGKNTKLSMAEELVKWVRDQRHRKHP